MSLSHPQLTATLVSAPAHFIVGIFTASSYCECLHLLMSLPYQQLTSTLVSTPAHFIVGVARAHIYSVVIVHTCLCIISVVISTAVWLSLHLIIVSLSLRQWFRLTVSAPGQA